MLRHACGFYLANQGYDLRLIQDYLGHRDPKHTVYYTRIAGVRFEELWGSQMPIWHAMTASWLLGPLRRIARDKHHLVFGIEGDGVGARV